MNSIDVFQANMKTAKFRNSTNSKQISIEAPNLLATSATYILPENVPADTSAKYLTSDTSGNMTWAAASGGSGTSFTTSRQYVTTLSYDYQNPTVLQANYIYEFVTPGNNSGSNVYAAFPAQATSGATIWLKYISEHSGWQTPNIRLGGASSLVHALWASHYDTGHDSNGNRSSHSSYYQLCGKNKQQEWTCIMGSTQNEEAGSAKTFWIRR